MPQDGRAAQADAEDVRRLPGRRRSRSSGSRPSPASSRRTRSSPRARPRRHVRPLLFVVGVGGAFLTGLYTFRMVFIVFGGEPSAYAREHLHAPSTDRAVDLRWPGRSRCSAVLAVGRRLAPVPGVWTPIATGSTPVAGRSSSRAGAQEAVASIVAVGARRRRASASPGRIYSARERRSRGCGRARVLEHKFYFDELYDAVFYRPRSRSRAALHALSRGRWSPARSAASRARSRASARRAARRVQTGLVRTYALALAGSVAVLAVVFLCGALSDDWLTTILISCRSAGRSSSGSLPLPRARPARSRSLVAWSRSASGSLALGALRLRQRRRSNFDQQ